MSDVLATRVTCTSDTRVGNQSICGVGWYEAPSRRQDPASTAMRPRNDSQSLAPGWDQAASATAASRGSSMEKRWSRLSRVSVQTAADTPSIADSGSPSMSVAGSQS